MHLIVGAIIHVHPGLIVILLQGLKCIENEQQTQEIPTPMTST